MAKKTWIEKRDGSKTPEVKECPNGFADIKPGQMMLIPSATQIDSYIRNIPEGREANIKDIRTDLAKASGAEISCPVVTGIQLRVVAEAADEELQAGANLSDITPIWRVIGPKTPTLKKLSYDSEFIMLMREKEGIGN